ncbi:MULTISPECIES: carbohydrate porin [Vibrio]|uniref:Carbohydrate porin n=1 Tax=Vibrio plantisponsor TaxID=664643 RepID=A0ABU4IIH4_9VIBR|nr:MULTISPECIES: carbohydrate porin [Vibrio]PNH87985.1 carbohydrate porin [Vibrio diazotrophicus]EGS56154.1 maltoporin [Vibrio paracholerae HE-09]EMP95921.1 maltoporin [Vibrio paracholerae 87395]MBW5419606.1 carbohydrate porin [Vibrio cholerae]MCO7030654.1 carbohydrate porin [Vibrio paracholerae]
MKNFKVLPITFAVASILSSASVFAADTDISALEKRIQELEAKVVEIDYVNDQQQAVLTPDTKVPQGIIFSGYARYGAHYSDSDNRYVLVGSSGKSLGRLGNEANGGEFQFGKIFQADNGAKWDLVLMIDEWSHRDWIPAGGSAGGVSLKKMYAGVTNIFESQPELYMWAGRDFHGRLQQGLNDYFVFTHDGQGAGFNNLNLGGAKLDMGFVGKVDSSAGSLNNDTGVYAITSRLHSINAGIGNLDLYANYGFASDQAGADKTNEDSWQVGAVLGLGSSNKLVMKYADGADDSAFDLAGDKQVVYASLEGNAKASDQFIIDYLVSYKNIAGADADEKNEYAGIVRPQYQWDEVHSTWLEAGYAMEDWDNGKEVNGWKVTLSQNVSLGGLPWSRPMLRFYTTVGDVETTEAGSSTSTTVDTVAVGAMFEAWW